MNGFSLIEVVVAIGILIVILAMGLPVGFDFYLDYEFDSVAETFNALLKQARTQAMANINENAHGVYINSSSFVVFEGTSYATRVVANDQVFPRNSAITVVGAIEQNFLALNGQTASTTYTVSDSRKNRSIFVNMEGLVYE